MSVTEDYDAVIKGLAIRNSDDIDYEAVTEDASEEVEGRFLVDGTTPGEQVKLSQAGTEIPAGFAVAQTGTPGLDMTLAVPTPNAEKARDGYPIVFVEMGVCQVWGYLQSGENLAKNVAVSLGTNGAVQEAAATHYIVGRLAEACNASAAETRCRINIILPVVGGALPA